MWRNSYKSSIFITFPTTGRANPPDRRAEEEDIKEDSLLYAFLLKQPPQQLDLEQAKVEIELFLQTKFGIKVNFDHEDRSAG